MKSFKDYLTEANDKVYEFKLGIAGNLPDDCEANVKTCLEKFKVATIGSGKKTPIQERPLDFPQLENMEVTYYEFAVKYPTTPPILQEYIGQCCNIPQSHIIVRGADENQEMYQDEMNEKTDTYEPILDQEDMGGTSAQSNVGNNRVMDLLKELDKARNESGDNTVKMETTNEPQNNKSAIGS